MKESLELGILTYIIEVYKNYYTPSDLKPSVWPNMYARGTLQVTFEVVGRTLKINIEPIIS